MAYWLLKSEPDTYSIDDLAREVVATWEGVRNPFATAHLRAMRIGDLAFFHHSNAKPPGVAGICEIAREAYPDDTAFDPDSPYFDPRSDPANPRWFRPDVRFVRRFPRLVPLPEIRRTPGLQDMVLVQQARLSVQPVTEKEWEIVCALGEGSS